MAWTITVNGAERQDFVRFRTLQVHKDGAVETARLDFIDHDGGMAMQVMDGDDIRIRQDGAAYLEFGGEVASIRVQRLDKSNPGTPGIILTSVDVQGWSYEATNVVESIAFPAGMSLYDVAQQLRVSFLAQKGWTTNMPSGGSPVLPALTWVHQPVATMFDELTALTGWPWRVNGDKVFAFVNAGTLPAPVDFTSASGTVVLTGLHWSRERLRRATRVLVTTGGKDSENWTDTHTGNGVHVQFPLSVWPTDKKLPTKVVEGGTTHTIGAGRWIYVHDDATVRIVGGGAAPGAGVTITVSYQVDLPAVVRTYDANVLDGYGTWNYAYITDAQVQGTEQTTLAGARDFAAATLTNRLGNPKAITLSTFARGIYPWQTAYVDFPERGLSGPYLIQGTTLTDVGRRNQHPVMEVRLLEGNAVGRDWTRYFKERKPTSSGGSSVVTGGGGTGGGGTGPATLPPGVTFHVAGDNDTAYAYPAAPAWRDAPQAVPTRLGGAGMAGMWLLRVPAFILTPGTLTITLFDFSTGAPLATVQTSKVAALLSGDFDFLQQSFSAPGDVHEILLRAQSTSGVLDAVIGHSTVVKV